MNVLEFIIVPGFVMWGTNPSMSYVKPEFNVLNASYNAV